MLTQRSNRKKIITIPFVVSFLLVVLLSMLPISPGVLADEESPVYEYISFGTTGDNVLSMQTRLMQLSYFHDDIYFTPMVYDNGTQQALENFCKTNNISYSGTGASAALQSVLFSEGALPYPVSAEKRPLSERITAYMSANVSLFGGKIPMFLMWILSAVLIALILILLVYFFVPERKNSNSGSPSRNPPKYWRKTMLASKSNSAFTRKNVRESITQSFELQIRYRDSMRTVRCNYPPSITIGRKNCEVLLDGSDKSVSGSHCEIVLRGAMPVLRDHSSNGTLLNGRSVHHAECRLRNGDRLSIGSHEVTVQL